MSRQLDFDNLTKGDVQWLEANGRGKEVEAAKARKAAAISEEQEAQENVPPAGSEQKDPSGLDAKSDNGTPDPSGKPAPPAQS